MMSFDLSDWYKKNTEKNSLFSYMGTISDSKISDILDEVEDILIKKGEKVKKLKRVYYIAVETLQNLYHHSEKPDFAEANDSVVENNIVFVLNDKVSEKYQIITGNFIKKNNIRILKERIDQLNFLTKEEVRVLYKLILNNEEFSEKGGGGLGMVDLVKRTGNNLTYNFHNFDKDYIFFSLRIAI